MTDQVPFRCPTCNARQEPSAECRRCKSDLSMLIAARQECKRLYEDCLLQLSKGHADAAEQTALRRWTLSADQDAARLLSMTYLLQGRFQAALDISEIDTE